MENNYVKPYMDYDWFFDKYINRNMKFSDIAEKYGFSLRVIQKWGNERHHINKTTYKYLKKLSDIQKEIVIVGTLGDGHIDKRPGQAMYIESHSEDEKDYLMWKYHLLEDLCNKTPRGFYQQKDTFHSNKKLYRFNTRIINELEQINNINRVDKIKSLSIFQLCLLILDDGSRDTCWSLCVASWSSKEKTVFLETVKSKHKIRGHVSDYDDRYIFFDSISSNRIDQYILENIPNDLDIVKKKIINNKSIPPTRNSIYVLHDDDKVGLARYCKTNKLPYIKVRDIIKNQNLTYNEIEESKLKELILNKENV